MTPARVPVRFELPAGRHRWAVGLTVLAFSVLVTASPAAAHDQLLETTPATDSIVSSAPAELTMRFRDEVLDISSQVIVRGPTGDVVADVEGVIGGTTVSAPLPPDLGEGTYRVAWRVVSGDGHPLQGSFAFSIGSVSAPLPTATGPAAPDLPVAASPAADVVPGSRSTLGLVAGLGGVAALVVVIALVRRRRERSA